MEANQVKGVGTLKVSDDDQIYLQCPDDDNGYWDVPVVVDPAWEPRIEWGEKYSATGYLASPPWARKQYLEHGVQEPTPYDTCLYISQLVKKPHATAKPPSGEIVVHPSKWVLRRHFGRNSIEVVMVADTDKHGPIHIDMPAVHKRWALNDLDYLIGQSICVAVEVAEESRLKCSKLLWSAPRQEKTPPALPPTPGSIKWERRPQAVRTGKRSSVGVKLRREVFMRDRFRCQECGVHPDATHRHVFLEVDHIIPVARGGTNRLENLQTLCDVCNAGKSDMKPVLKVV